MRRLLISLMMFVLPASAIPAPIPAPTVKTPKEKDARRAELLKIIERQDQIIAIYNRQTSFDKIKQVTEEQYEEAKRKRAAAQAERDSLAN